MEELPEIKLFEDTDKAEKIPQNPKSEVPQELPPIAANHNDVEKTTPPLTEAILQYELNISPGVKALVELAQKPESDFDRRHETMDNSTDIPVSSQPMVPIGQILQARAAPPRSQHPFLSSSSPANGAYRRLIPIFLIHRSIILMAFIIGLLFSLGIIVMKMKLL